MRIAFFHATLPEAGRKPGGVEVFVHRLANNLAGRGHTVTVLSFVDPPADATYEHVRMRPRAAGSHKLGRMFIAPLLLNRVNTENFDVLHLHGDDWFFVRRRIPTLRTFYGSALAEARHATRWRRGVSEAIIFLLEVVAARLATSSYGISPGWERAYDLAGYLHCGVDASREQRSARTSHPTLLFVGTWHGRKRGRFLHEIFHREVLPVLPDAELWMVSDACAPSISVRWIAAPSDEELALLYEQAWAFCLPSTYEGFGIPYVEAMAHGTPVIASPNPGARYVLDDGRFGAIAKDGELGAALVGVLSSEEIRHQLETAGAARARDFSWDVVLPEYERAYADAIQAWSAKNGLTARSRGSSRGR